MRAATGNPAEPGVPNACPNLAAAPTPRRLRGARPDRSREAFLLLLSTHFLVDCFSSALPTVQPILAERFGLSLAQAGILGGCFLFSSSVLQLPFGLVSDRLRSRHFTIFGPVIAAVFLSSLGLAAGFGGLIALLLVGGMGVAAYHPHSTSQAGHLGGHRRGFATAVFITAGTAGLGLGPLYLTAVYEQVGLERLWFAALPVVAALPVLLWRLPAPLADSNPSKARVDWQALRGQGRALATHYTFVVLRSVLQVSMAQFLSLYMVRVRGASLELASIALSMYLLSTSLGAFLGGAASDRFGGRNVCIGSCIGSVPLLVLFLTTDGWISLAALFAGGVVLLTTIPVNVVMAQELVPSQASTTSALMMGFGWGIAGIVFMPVVGLLADAFGLGPVFWGLLGLPLLALPFAAALPRHRQLRQAG